MKNISIRGYCDRPSVATGETIRFYVSADKSEGSYDAELVRLIHGDSNPAGPGYKEEPVKSALEGRYPARFQRTQFGSFVEVPDSEGALQPSGAFSVHTFLWPTTPGRGRQGIISRWDDERQCGWCLTIEKGRLVFTVGDGSGATSQVVSDRALFQEVWYSVTAVFDPVEKVIILHQKSVVNRTNSRFGLVVPLDSDTVVSAAADVTPSDSGTSLLIAGLGEAAARNGRTWCIANFNGKIDAPKMYGRALRDDDAQRLSQGKVFEPMARLAHWDFAAESDRMEFRPIMSSMFPAMAITADVSINRIADRQAGTGTDMKKTSYTVRNSMAHSGFMRTVWMTVDGIRILSLQFRKA
ncbi:hypothetical protein GCM10025880_64460 [Methylorubrum aminovorans]|uniref:LamG-like jellyroll fold domain-containing protein n=1 Tax=Methylorubrum aminovorans TaxID=269069 RepID=UPI0023E97487|nr:LamG-like jellyroll fold domain-containing protein [Methylorubrum aminovorans]GMA80029.1 hypothetical protein GCM10025880_64460 [Methylorubrum aminovorans]